ncbi:phenylalanine--tRNA ligase subunit beta [Coemansia asiatica]|uniref:phenylalanine--tRNA ligase n=1 Tax=Coemansia asiatica TaxID=1052880 RepID=A0A9W7XNY8_9FUNG|nr:phenylalanine--tRNA ligase subunit beta [Coemansia asiatica]
MPTINIDKQDLFEYLDYKHDTEQFRELCFEFGIELEEDSSEEGELAEGERAMLKIDIPANRYDLLCIEGLSRALGVFLGREKEPQYRVVSTDKPHRITVSPECAQVRPYIVGAILRGVKLTQERYQSFIDLQSKLHHNLCRKRTLVAIGTHDLDTVQGPFTYEARKPEDIKFVPLKQTEKMDGNRVIEFYEKDLEISKFLDIIRDSPVYPVVYDSTNTVLSLPPLINSNHSKISVDTKNIFIEATATDITRANMVLNILVTMFSGYCAEPFTVEPVEVVYPDGQHFVYPQLGQLTMETSTKYLNSIVGINQSSEEIVTLLKKMSLEATVEKSSHSVTGLLKKMSLSSKNSEYQHQHQQGDEVANEKILVKLPVTRPDILQECDIAEDLAIAFGYNKIPRAQNNEATVGKALPLNKLTDLVRKEIAMAGWTEALTLSLCSHDENFKFLRRTDNGDEVVVLEKPKSIECQIGRSTMLPGLLKTIRENKKYPIPFKLFEVSDVILKNPARERRAQTERRACALFSSRMAQFEIIQGLLDTVMQSLYVAHTAAGSGVCGYYLEEAENPTYLSGRSANVVYLNESGQKIVLGLIGVIHPEVLGHFELDYPVSAFEINIEPFL